MNTFIKQVNSKYGAPMGRFTGPNFLDTDAGKIVLRRIYLDNGGYDRGGAYWGHGEPLYETMDEEGNGFILRANSRDKAKAIIWADFFEAKFYN
jgi:hypothetical protein